MWQLQSVSQSTWDVTVATVALKLGDNANSMLILILPSRTHFMQGHASKCWPMQCFIYAYKMMKIEKTENCVWPGRPSMQRLGHMDFGGARGGGGDIHGQQSLTMASCPSSIIVIFFAGGEGGHRQTYPWPCLSLHI